MAGVSVTAFFVSVLIVMHVVLTMRVALYRREKRISLSDGDDRVLRRRIRAHGNFTETVPIILVGMLVCELMAAPLWLLVGGGLALLVGRLCHAYILVTKEYGSLRVVGMSLTMLAALAFALFLFVSFVKAL